MDGITKQTRRQSYDGIRTRSGERCKLILETLGNRSMTVEEITDELVAAGHLKYYDRNFVAPRLTELKGAGVLEVVGKKPSKRTGKNTAVWAAVSPMVRSQVDDAKKFEEKQCNYTVPAVKRQHLPKPCLFQF